MVFKKSDAFAIMKHGVQMHIYNTAEQCPQAAVVLQETGQGHGEEFLHETSAFIYYILEGTGTWVIEDEEFEVQASDVVIVPPGKRFYFRGALKQLCITAPAWTEQHEKHIRYIDLAQ